MLTSLNWTYHIDLFFSVDICHLFSIGLKTRFTGPPLFYILCCIGSLCDKLKQRFTPLRADLGRFALHIEAPQDLMLSLQQTRRLQQEEQEERMD